MDRKWWTLITVCVGTFMLLLDVTIVNVALPTIQSSLKASFSDLQWVIDAYSLMLAALLLTTGSLADLYGRRLVFVIGLVVFSLASVMSGLAPDPLFLNIARGAQGIGGAAMFSTSLALLGSAFSGRERGVAFGTWGAITGLAVAIGPVIGGALTTGLGSWRWIFLINAPIGVAAVVLAVTRMQETRQAGARRPDIFGVITFSGALGALVYALIKGDSTGWGSAEILVCLIGSGVLLLAFLVGERLQREEAMFDLSLFRKPTFAGGSLAAFSLSAGMFAMLLYLTLYLQDVLHYSALDTGLRLLVISGGILTTSTLAGRLTAHVPIRLLIAPGLALVGIGLLLMRGLSAGSGWTHLIAGFVVGGVGVGLINPPLASTAIGVVKPERAGMASGINSTCRQVGIATGIAGLGSLFSHRVRTDIVSLLAGSPHLSSHQIATLAAGVAHGGGAGRSLAAISVQARPAAVLAVRTGFVAGLNEILLVGAVLCLASATLTLVLIRGRDFEIGAARGPAATPEPAAAPEPARAVAASSASNGRAAGERTADGAVGDPSRTAVSDPRRDLLERQQAVTIAAEQAAGDFERRVEHLIDRRRAELLSAADEQSRQLHADALAQAEEYAGALRRRRHELQAERERLVTELREQVAAAAEHVDRIAATRAALYRVIGELAASEPDGSAGSDRSLFFAAE